MIFSYYIEKKYSEEEIKGFPRIWRFITGLADGLFIALILITMKVLT